MGVKSETIINMKKFAEMLQGGEMTEKEAWQKLGMSQPRFRTFVTSMTEYYLIYEDNGKIGILK